MIKDKNLSMWPKVLPTFLRRIPTDVGEFHKLSDSLSDSEEEGQFKLKGYPYSLDYIEEEKAKRITTKWTEVYQVYQVQIVCIEIHLKDCIFNMKFNSLCGHDSRQRPAQALISWSPAAQSDEL